MAAGTLAALLAPVSVSAQAAQDPLTKPIIGSHTAEWLAPAPPEKIFGKSYLVGFGGLSVALIDTGAGLILIDGALPQAAPAILNNVRRLGFRPRDIKYILSTEPHFDHAGGIAALARDTGATVLASPRGAQGLMAGRMASDDPQRGYNSSWPAVAKVQTIRGGQTLRLGNTTVTALATPGHTMGSMSWRWQSCEGRACRTIVFAASLNPVSTDDYRYTAPRARPIVAGFQSSYTTMSATPCDILISAHPDNAGKGRYNNQPGACRAYVERSRKALNQRIKSERGHAQAAEHPELRQ
ncbi:subclass B3 metallo-beta-lactamase [Novosphingobium sp. KACC 22771]|uniref:subclass B3 metallo-beta-lactamase n=1 Tax=Novosphingobium sp. KACC 22771 TaxID=3025670 RepID=UPI00236511F2|nr:subclass B3 metallo-beta-lactamase [Novosphingobium sp. KACC 22771]WDF74140.1 subclass B3 metallo-beta-lactamase [Novosphingobium sp. KACC 22771]